MKLGIVFSKKIEELDKLINHLLSVIINLDVEVFLEKNFNNIFNSNKIKYVSSIKDLGAISDIILIFGGDGTIIQNTKLFLKNQKPILGINSGNIGFLSSMEKTDLYKIKEILEGKYTITEKVVIECTVEDKTFLALNEIVLNKDINSRIINYSVFDEKPQKICEYNSDGIILATPTGSTAYSLSSGGPILESELENFVITPICSHNIFSRSFVVDSNKKLITKYNLKKDSKVCIFIDGHIKLISPKNDEIKICSSKYKAKFIKFSNYNLYDNVKKKLFY